MIMKNAAFATPRLLRLLPLAAAILLVACGGGGGSSSSSSGGGSSASSTTSGTASKGILIGATVKAYAITGGTVATTALATATTSSTGQYSLNLGSYTGPVLIALDTTSGTATMKCDNPAGCGASAFGATVAAESDLVLKTVAVSTGGSLSTALTPFTTLATAYAQSLSGGLTAANIATAQAQIGALFSLPDLNATQPIDITGSSFGSDVNAQHYALLNAAIAKLAADKGLTVTGLVNSLVNQLTNADHNGQLLSNSSTTISLASVLDAAKAVAADSHVSGKLDSLVAAATAQDDATANAATANSVTTAAPPPSVNASDLNKAKTFVSSTHTLLQSLRALDNPTVISALKTRYQSLLPYFDPETTGTGNGAELSAVYDSTDAVLSYLGYIATISANDGESHSYGNTDFQAWLNTHYNSNTLQITATGFGFTVSSSTHTAVISQAGGLSYQPMTYGYYCTQSCVLVNAPKGAAYAISVGLLGLSYPDANAVQTSYSLGILPQGSISGSTSRLDLSSLQAASLNLSFASNSNTLSNVISAIQDGELVPSSAEFILQHATLLAGASAGSSNYPYTFVGSVKVDASKATLNTSDGTSSRQILVPSLLQLSGSFSSTAGDSLAASLSISLNTSSTLPLISPAGGSTRNGLYSYQYNNDGTATFAATPPQGTTAVTDYGNIAYYNSVQLRLVTNQTDYPCYGGNAIQVYAVDPVTKAVNSPTINCTSDTTLPTALADFGWGANSNLGTYLLRYYLGLNLEGTGTYLPAAQGDFNYSSTSVQSVPGVLIDGGDKPSENSSNFAVAAIAASINATINVGGSNTTAAFSLNAGRTAYESGQATVTFTLGNNESISIATAVVNGVSTYTVSDHNGVSVNVSHGSSDTAPVSLTVNGVQQGVIGEVGGVPVARFSDNSLMAL